MSTLGSTVRRNARQKQRQLIRAISSEDGIEQAVKEYMYALGMLRAELFSIVALSHQMKKAGHTSKTLHDGARPVADIAA